MQLLGAQAGDQESFRVTLDRVPPQIGKLAFTATLDGQGQMSQVASGYIRIAVGGQEVVRYAFTGTEFSTERAVMIADIYRKEPNVWRFAAVGQGFDGGLKALLENFGGEAMEDEDDGKRATRRADSLRRRRPPRASFGPPPGAPAPQPPAPQPNPSFGPPPGAPQPVPAHSAPPMQPPGQFPGQAPPPGQFPRRECRSRVCSSRVCRSPVSRRPAASPA
ncbi:TerD family protein [Yinghuangia aomiensis]